LDSYQFGQPVKTKLQAVIAAQKGELTFPPYRISRPTAIFVESMDYQEAIHRVEQPGSTTYYNPNLSDTSAWLAY
jgi:hypothetical protein